MGAIIVSAFPGMGKSYAYNLLKNDIKVLDSDSSKFDKDNFPWNYIEHIKDNIDNCDIIFVSSHKEVRDTLNNEGIDFDLFYPAKERRNEFLQNYVSRHSPRNLIMKIDNNWNKWIDEIETEDNPHCHLHCLREQGQFIGNNPMIMQFVAQVKKDSDKKEVKQEAVEVKNDSKEYNNFIYQQINSIVNKCRSLITDENSDIPDEFPIVLNNNEYNSLLRVRKILKDNLNINE